MIVGVARLCWAIILLSAYLVYWMLRVSVWVGVEIFHRLNSLRAPKHVSYIGHPAYLTSPPKPNRPITRAKKLRELFTDIRTHLT
jgi:hypothetical protein